MNDFTTASSDVNPSASTEYEHTTPRYANQHVQAAEYACLRTVPSSEQEQVSFGVIYQASRFKRKRTKQFLHCLSFIIVHRRMLMKK